MNPFPIYQLTEQIRALDEAIAEEFVELGAPTDETWEALAVAEADAEERAVICAKLAREHERSATFLDEDIVALKARRSRHEKMADLYKGYTLKLMAFCGLKKLSRPGMTVSACQNSQKTIIPTVALINIPRRFLREKVELVLDREKILAAWAANEEIEGVDVTLGNHLRITV